jgi:hypothetical protein
MEDGGEIRTVLTSQAFGDIRLEPRNTPKTRKKEIRISCISWLHLTLHGDPSCVAHGALQNAATGHRQMQNRKGRRDWSQAARLGFFRGFSNRAGGGRRGAIGRKVGAIGKMRGNREIRNGAAG